MHPLFAARAAGAVLEPTTGMVEPASYAEGVIRFDEAHPEWRERVADIACGIALRGAGYEDSAGHRFALAYYLGLSMPSDGCHIEPANCQVLATVQRAG